MSPVKALKKALEGIHEHADVHEVNMYMSMYLRK
jgi:hypothetical protein